MEYVGRAQALVMRDGRILMARHIEHGREYYVLPGGAIEPGETPEEAVCRELLEECCVRGEIVRKLSEYLYSDGEKVRYTYEMNIGDQEPTLGEDPEIDPENPILNGVVWMRPSELTERDRAYLWAAGLAGVRQFHDEIASWADDISYPALRGE
ncbi:MAG: NUDIX domain-containing protein [Ruminococcaceae bacterium]|nr:NUDIX domain-containing protein [Oscillospiraceae bacterium]